MVSLSSLPSDILRGIAFYLDVIQITLLDQVLSHSARQRLRGHAVEHLEWSLYAPGDEVLKKRRLSESVLDGHCWLPYSLISYRNIRSVHLSTHRMPDYLNLSPKILHYEAWGATLTSLKLDMHHFLFSLLSPLGQSIYQHEPCFSIGENLMRFWKALSVHDNLPMVPSVRHIYNAPRPVYAHPCPNVSTLTNPWLPLRDILPRLSILHLFISGSSCQLLGDVYTAEYVSLLWRQLPDDLVELCHDLTHPTHPAMIPHLPPNLQIYHSPSVKQNFVSLSLDERTDFSFNTGQVKLPLPTFPASLHTLIIPATQLDFPAIESLPRSITKLQCLPDATVMAPNHLQAPALEPIILPPRCLIGLPLDKIVSKLSPNVEHLEDSDWSQSPFTGWEALTVYPLTHLAICIVRYDALSFSHLPSTLKSLRIQTLLSPSATSRTTFKKALTAAEYHLIDQATLSTLPASLTSLEISLSNLHHRALAHGPDRCSLAALPCASTLCHLAITSPFFIDHSPLLSIPNLDHLNLPCALYTPHALNGMTDFMKLFVDQSEQVYAQTHVSE